MPLDMNHSHYIEIIDQKSLLAPINQVREAQGLWPVKWRPDLTCVAQKQADILVPPVRVEDCNHGSFEYRVRTCEARAYGEVIACNFTSLEAAVRGLFTSPKHYTIMMTPNFSRAGVGVNVSGQYYTFVITFGI